jgi:hypothetical protein
MTATRAPIVYVKPLIVPPPTSSFSCDDLMMQGKAKSEQQRRHPVLASTIKAEVSGGKANFNSSASKSN